MQGKGSDLDSRELDNERPGGEIAFDGPDDLRGDLAEIARSM